MRKLIWLSKLLYFYQFRYILHTLQYVLPDDGGLPPEHVAGIKKFYLQMLVFLKKEVKPFMFTYFKLIV
jgi:hypothetical protein